MVLTKISQNDTPNFTHLIIKLDIVFNTNES